MNAVASMELRPHHILDIVTTYGHGHRFEPHPYGHANHTVAEAILTGTGQEIRFVVGADEICRPCRRLRPDGQCAHVPGIERVSSHPGEDPGSRLAGLRAGLEKLGIQTEG